MTRRAIIECDRCHIEIKNNKVTLNETSYGAGSKMRIVELCGGCEDKLARFLDGQELEVPP